MAGKAKQAAGRGGKGKGQKEGGERSKAKQANHENLLLPWKKKTSMRSWTPSPPLPSSAFPSISVSASSSFSFLILLVEKTRFNLTHFAEREIRLGNAFQTLTGRRGHVQNQNQNQTKGKETSRKTDEKSKTE